MTTANVPIISYIKRLPKHSSAASWAKTCCRNKEQYCWFLEQVSGELGWEPATCVCECVCTLVAVDQVFNFLWQPRVCVSMWVMNFASGSAHAGMCNRGQLSTTLRATLHTLPRWLPLKANRAAPPSAVASTATLCNMVPCGFFHIHLRSRWRMGNKTTVVMDGQPHLSESHWAM